MDADRYIKIRKELEEIKGMIEDVSNQVQELREAIRESSNEDQELPVPELYEHPWYKYKREQLIVSGNYTEPTRQGSSAA